MNDCSRDPRALEDVELVELARRGDPAAFGELWRRHHGLAVALLRPLVEADAEDVASEAFTQVWAQMRKGGGPDSHFKAYLVCTAKRLAYRVQRERERRALELADEHLIAAEAEADDPFESIEIRERVIAAFESIPERWARLLWLSAYEDRSRAELREMLDLTPKALSSITYRARTRFREVYEPAVV